ncbi:MAG: RNA 2',3'-cyclic phosphodiesterase [Acidimicrobiia bacterium]|nr:RNA 2',3'-cyclic phosphodiesterase [Acidimicrobiia bacterium]
MRLFTGIEIPAPALQPVGRLLDRLRPLAPLRWSKVENLHITTKFIGEWPEERLNELIRQLRDVDPGSSFEISLHGLGWFPEPQRPHIFHIGVQAGAPLIDLAARTERALAALGIEPENRPYRPHLTLARIQPRGGRNPNLDALRKAVACKLDQQWSAFTCACFHLYRSQPGAAGSQYTQIAAFPIPAAERGV